MGPHDLSRSFISWTFFDQCASELSEFQEKTAREMQMLHDAPQHQVRALLGSRRLRPRQPPSLRRRPSPVPCGEGSPDIRDVRRVLEYAVRHRLYYALLTLTQFDGVDESM